MKTDLFSHVIPLPWDDAIKALIKREGGLADRPLHEDPGGLTNYGITQGLYAALGGRGSVRSITKLDAMNFYKEHFVAKNKLHIKLTEKYERLQGPILDAMVHHGPARAVTFLQIAINLTLDKVILNPDGQWGIQTQLALEKVGEDNMVSQLSGYYKSVRYTYLFTRPHAKYNRGWFKRVLEVHREA